MSSNRFDRTDSDRSNTVQPRVDFQSIFESCPHPYLILLAAPPFTIVAVSERYLSVTGTERSALIGRGLFEAFPPNPGDPTDSGAADLLASLEQVLRQRAQDVMGVQRYDIPNAAGFDVKYWSPVNTPIFDKSGDLALIIHHVEDVTEFVQMRTRLAPENGERRAMGPDRMQAEVLLRAHEVKEANRKLIAAQKALQMREAELAHLNESLEQRVLARTLELQASNNRLANEIGAKEQAEERFRRVIEFAPSAILLTNRDGVIEMANAQTEQIFKYSKAELLGRSIDLLVPPRLRDQHPRLRASFHGAPAPRPMGAGRSLYGLRKDGSEFPLEIALNPVETEEGIKVLAAVADISERKQKEENIQSALKEKITLLSEIHHRVKNNLQIISSLLDLQAMNIEDSAIRAMLQSSMARVQSMALIHQTLYQSQNFARVNFAEVLDTLVANVSGACSLDGARLRVTMQTNPIELSISAAIPCGLIVNELITNAFKHAFPAGKNGEIVIELTASADNQAMLAVSDNGAGLPPASGADTTRTLGLELVNILTEQLGGTLSIQRSNPTRFAIQFPLSNE